MQPVPFQDSRQQPNSTAPPRSINYGPSPRTPCDCGRQATHQHVDPLRAVDKLCCDHCCDRNCDNYARAYHRSRDQT